MAQSEKEEVLRTLENAVRMLLEGMDPLLIPEVGSNIAYALAHARTPGDVAAVEGRIVRLKGRAHAVGPVAFGASDHVARIVLTAMKFDPEVRCAANIRYSPERVAACEDMLLSVCSFDRASQPPGVKTMGLGRRLVLQGRSPGYHLRQGGGRKGAHDPAPRRGTRSYRKQHS